MDQPDITLSGVVVGSNIIATWAPKGFARRISRISIIGPAPSNFDIYVGAVNVLCRKGNTTRGDNNQADFVNPIPVPAGMLTYFVWSAYAAPVASTVTVGYERV